MTRGELITAVTTINPAISAFPAGEYYIEGCFRAKKSETYKYDCRTNTFVYNTCKPAVANAFEQATKSL